MVSQIKHIVIADDDADDRDLLQEAIIKDHPDILVTLADDGRILLDKLKNLPPPDFIILDINMPGLNGHECLKTIREKHSMQEVPVMIYSTSSEKRDIEEAGSNGANFYVTKPDSLEAIEQLAQDICNGALSSLTQVD